VTKREHSPVTRSFFFEPEHRKGADNQPQCFTILWQQDDINALQVLNTAKKWINAVPIRGSLVVKCVDFVLHSTSPDRCTVSATSLHVGQVRGVSSHWVVHPTLIACAKTTYSDLQCIVP
jgi:hypothetical protein